MQRVDGSGTAKQTHRYYIGGSKERHIVISSNFDSGNLADVKQISQFSYRISSASDCVGTPYEGNTRSWFYFSATGFPPNTRGRFLINRVNILWSFINSKMGLTYHPCYNNQPDNYATWKKLQQPGSVYENVNGEVQLQFDYLFTYENEVVRFALTYPYEYSRCTALTKELCDKFQNDDDVLFEKEVIVKTPQDRDVELLTISDKKSISLLKQREERLAGLFPVEDRERPMKEKKPVILISSRVHPGETPSSYALEGLLKFLTNKQDLRSQLLLKFFTFKIVPMLNPDGVEKGNYRMDTHGQNLNRYYNNCSQIKQPSIFALRSLMEYYARQSRLMFYFDLHAHPARKGCFVYGNALSDFTQQVENYIFCKVMSLNTPYFEYQSCNFSQKHMKHKDRFEELTKEGCGRVFAHKCSGIVHSFTLELGYHFTNIMNNVPAVPNPQFQWNGLAYRPLLDCSGDSAYLTPKAYENVGQSLMISVLDVLQKNPYSRVVTSEYCTLENLRRLTAFEVFHEDERFRMFEVHTYTKVKHINDLIEESLYSKVYKHFIMPPDVEWPSCVRVGKDPIINKLRQSSEQSHSPSPKHSDKIQLPDIKPKPFNLKIRSCSVKKDEQEKAEEVDQDSVESSEESESQVMRTEEKQTKGLDDLPIKASSASPSNKLKLLNLKFSMRNPPVLNLVPFSDGGLSESSNLNFTTSNRQVKQVNLTFQQNFLVFPSVDKPPTNKNSTSFIYQNISSKGLLVDAFRTAEYQKKIFEEETIIKAQSLKITGEGKEIIHTDLNDQQLKEQLLRQMEYFKKQIKEQFSKDIKKEVTEQINKSTFARGYMKNKRQAQYGRQRRNKFFPNSDQQIFAVSNFKQQDKSKIVRLPSIGK